jgi:3-oxoadipate CoA-transferase alpha subunit
MINKISASIAEALAGVQDGATVLIGGFGTAGIPNELIGGLIDQGARGLTVVNNNAGNGDTGLAALLKTGRVRKVICSFPRQADSHVFDGLYRSGRIELELVPQGNLAERLRAAGAGVGAFFTPTGYGTDLAKLADGSPKETRVIAGKAHVLEYPIHGDIALIKAERTSVSWVPSRSRRGEIWRTGVPVNQARFPPWAAPWIWPSEPSRPG